MLALGARLVHEVGTMLSGAQQAGQRLATYAVDGTVRFSSAASRASFADELSVVLADLVEKYDDPAAPGGREHRLVVALHPVLKPAPDGPSRCQAQARRKARQQSRGQAGRQTLVVQRATAPPGDAERRRAEHDSRSRQ